MVDPQYRGQNIFNNIYDFLFEKCLESGINVIWGYTAAKKPFQKIAMYDRLTLSIENTVCMV